MSPVPIDGGRSNTTRRSWWRERLVRGKRRRSPSSLWRRGTVRWERAGEFFGAFFFRRRRKCLRKISSACATAIKLELLSLHVSVEERGRRFCPGFGRCALCVCVLFLFVGWVAKLFSKACRRMELVFSVGGGEGSVVEWREGAKVARRAKQNEVRKRNNKIAWKTWEHAVDAPHGNRIGTTHGVKTDAVLCRSDWCSGCTVVKPASHLGTSGARGVRTLD